MVKKNVGSNSMFSYIFLLYIKYHLHKGLAFCNDIALAILHLNREKKAVILFWEHIVQSKVGNIYSDPTFYYYSYNKNREILRFFTTKSLFCHDILDKFGKKFLSYFDILPTPLSILQKCSLTSRPDIFCLLQRARRDYSFAYTKIILH